MRLFIPAALLFMISGVGFTEEPKPVEAPSKLSEEHVARWKAITGKLNAHNSAVDKAELEFYRAKEARDKAVAIANEEFAKMQQEAKCAGCIPDAQMRWQKPK